MATLESQEEVRHRTGFVCLVGRPNVGKSTLLNRLVGSKVAAVADKPQTTRNRIVGIVSRPGAQIVFVDTPGIHAARAPLNVRMVALARQALDDADLRLLVLDATRGITAEDRELAGEPSLARAALVVVTKADLVKRAALLPICAAAGRLLPDAAVVPVSGKTGDNVERLLSLIVSALPPGPSHYPEDQLSDQSERFLAAEIVREKVIEHTRDELPYATAVVIDAFREEPARGLVVIEAAILVERESQRGIVVGEQGRRVRDIGRAARLELEGLFGCRMFLQLHVKVLPDWSRDPRVLRDLGL